MKVFSSVVGILVLIGVLAFLVFRIYFINDTIVENAGYGFSIGMTKTEVFHKASSKYKSNSIYMLHPMGPQGWGPHYKTTFGEKELSILLDRDVWRFYFDEGYSNGITFKFRGEKLIEIWRHRGSFELP